MYINPIYYIKRVKNKMFHGNSCEQRKDIFNIHQHINTLYEIS